jgi:hypothetical protein
MPSDTSHPPPGDASAEDSHVEEMLRALPVPALPPEWRTGILRAARTPPWPWMTRPVQWSLAACWTVIGLLHLSMPAGPDPLPAGAKSPSPPGPSLPLDPDAQWLAGLEPHPSDTFVP